MYSNYATFGEFGCNNGPQQNPLTYCFVSGLDASFNHGGMAGDDGLLGQKGRACQIFSADYCAKNWNGICEFASRDEERNGTVVDQVDNNCGAGIPSNLSMGEILIRNTFKSKYMTMMSGNCKRVYQPFDPTVANSPLISTWESTGNGCGSTQNCRGYNVCVPIYEVSNPGEIDTDPVIGKVLAKPWIAIDILVNMYQNALKNNTLEKLKGTKLYDFFKSDYFQSRLPQLV
jgi:hypothetical protein